MTSTERKVGKHAQTSLEYTGPWHGMAGLGVNEAWKWKDETDWLGMIQRFGEPAEAH